MAKNRQPVKPVEPDTDSDDSTEPESDSENEQAQMTQTTPVKPDTDSGDSTEPESDSENEQAQMTQKTPYSQLPSQPVPFSSSDEDSESDSDPTQKSSTGARKPRSMLASAEDPAKSSNGAKKPRSKPVSAGQPPQEDNVTEGKTLERVEKKSTPLGVWSEGDVLVVLRWMRDYWAQKNTDPVADLDSFLHSIKEKLHFDVTRRQLHDKIRNLKRKYEANKKKEKKGQEMVLPNPHEQTVYDLSKSIWGKKDDEKVIVNAKANDSVVRRSLSKRKGDDKAVPVAAKRAKTVEDVVRRSPSKRTGDDKAVPAAKRAKTVEDVVRRSPSKRKGDDKAVPAAKRAKTVEEMVIVNAKAKESVLSTRMGGDRAFLVPKTAVEIVLSLGDKLFENEEQVEWNKLKLEDMEIYLQHLEVMEKQTKLVIDSFKSGVF